MKNNFMLKAQAQSVYRNSITAFPVELAPGSVNHAFTLAQAQLSSPPPPLPGHTFVATELLGLLTVAVHT